jgi:hypothetical protein
MKLPIKIQYYQQSRSNVTLPGEEKWADKWDVCVTCSSFQSAKELKEALIAFLEHTTKPKERQHITDGSPCWCNPELSYKDPITGNEVWTHKELQ